MTERPRTTLTGVVLDALDVPVLARFYRDLLGWDVVADEPGWAKLLPPGGGSSIAIQLEPLYAPPAWPSRTDAPQMMSHLDIEVEDLEAASAYAVALGATIAHFQPQDDVRVHLDPAGHPFCLWIRETA